VNSWWERARRIEGLVLDVDGVLTDGQVWFGHEGEAMRSFSVRDGLGVALLRRAGLSVAIVSGRSSPTVQHRADELGIDPVLLGRTDKSAALDEVLESWGLETERVAAVGDDLIDWPLLRRVGLSLAPADAHPLVRSRVDVVCAAEGGRGAVRETCELLLRATGRWMGTLASYGMEEEG
jgi:3-deoxy-D-manno-octulosonate 8-phosphate phosphatase (KDO 8-P phosphatase)